MFFPMFYGFLLPLSVAFVFLIVVFLYRLYGRKSVVSLSDRVVSSKDPYFLAPQYKSPMVSPFGSGAKDVEDISALKYSISRRNLRSLYSPPSSKELDLSQAKHLTATSPVLAAALEDVLRLSREVDELKTARASLRRLQTPTRPREEHVMTSQNLKYSDSSDASTEGPNLETGDGTQQFTEIDLGDGSQCAVWVRTDSITLV